MLDARRPGGRDAISNQKPKADDAPELIDGTSNDPKIPVSVRIAIEESCVGGDDPS